MQFGVQFRNGIKFALDFGPSVNARSVGAFVRAVGARAASEVKKTSERIARQATERIDAKRKPKP
jgi:hypothetical protein